MYMADSINEVHGVTVFRPGVSKVDQSNASVFLAPLNALPTGAQRIVLDLSEIAFLDSAGLGAIVSLIRQTRTEGGEIRLCNPRSAVKVLFSMVRLENIVKIDPDVDTAVTAIQGLTP